jgi:hypothetical protein
MFLRNVLFIYHFKSDGLKSIPIKLYVPTERVVDLSFYRDGLKSIPIKLYVPTERVVDLSF